MRYVEADGARLRITAWQLVPRSKKLLGAMIEPDLLVLDDLFLARRASRSKLRAAAGQRARALQAALRHRCDVKPGRSTLGKYLGDNTMSTTILARLMPR